MSGQELKNKKSVQIPVKNITIHKPNSVETYQPSDQIYVRKVSGFFQKLRQRMNLVYFAFFACLPWLQYNGHQAVLFDIDLQRFTLWGLTLWPQDLTLLAWLFILGAFLLFFVTTFLGGFGVAICAHKLYGLLYSSGLKKK